MPRREEASPTAASRRAASGRLHSCSAPPCFNPASCPTSTSAGPLRQLAEDFRLVAEGAAGQPTALQLEKAAIARDQLALNDRIERAQASYTRQFTALDLAVGRSRAMQSYLQQQIDLWTKSNN